LLIESCDGLILVDTGLGLQDVASPTERLGRAVLHLLRPVRDPAETAVHQVRARGFDPDDVRHIILTHLDPDHAGGLVDFPRAKVHVHRIERDAMLSPVRCRAIDRYRHAQWAHGPEWVLHEPVGERWKGFDSVRIIDSVGSDLLLIPLPGHSAGHCGVAVKTADGWLLHAGDAFDHRDEVHLERPRTPLALRWMQRYLATDWDAFTNNHERLRDLLRDDRGGVQVINAHDPVLFARFARVAGERLKSETSLAELKRREDSRHMARATLAESRDGI
jgi:glyoxylase-like metal-dependent hydrolase (beta-lactamase superfamily II)